MQGAWNAPALLRILGDLERYDLAVGSRINRTMWSGFATIPLTIGAFIGWIASLYPHALEVFGVMVAAVVIANWRFRKARESDIPDEIRLTIQPVIRSLVPDVDPAKKIRVDLQLNSRIEEKLDKHVECVCFVRMQLADASIASFRIVNSYRKSVRGKRNKNGKYKRKVKWKKKSVLTASLLPAPGAAWAAKRIQSQLQPKRGEKFRMTRSARGSRVGRLTRRYRFSKVGEIPRDTIPPRDVIDLFLRLALGRTPASG